jgi:FKBP-type peptidyl-prolyl cis-trans isomerase (trigger factor)
VREKIAEKEDIRVSQQEILERVSRMAVMYQIPPEKFLKDLQKRNGLIEIYDQIMSEKVIDLLQLERQDRGRSPRHNGAGRACSW